MKAHEFITEFYSPAEDNLTKYDYDDTRRPRLTLKKISKLRKMRDTQRVDTKNYLDFLPTMYGNKPDEGMM